MADTQNSRGHQRKGEGVTRIYYFTFGSYGQLYDGGWVRIQADSINEAQQKFVEHYGDKAQKDNGTLNYAFSYSENHFLSTSMAREGNFGKFEQEFIP